MKPDVVAVAPYLVLAVILLPLDDDAAGAVAALVRQEVEDHDVRARQQLDLLQLGASLLEVRQRIVLRLHLLESRWRWPLRFAQRRCNHLLIDLLDLAFARDGGRRLSNW